MPGSGSWTVLEPFWRGGLTTKAGEVVLIKWPGIPEYDSREEDEGAMPRQCCSVLSPPCQVTVCHRTEGLTFPSSAENSAWQL